ncbi:MAG: adenylyltransferase and sulfurtransferase [Chloroflexi bacterium]|jgi:adenylyltransferase/sulfurtransferase|nr:MAG: adenylyltransferase and sulfurtransferase [Chloroflexota bacterium]
MTIRLSDTLQDPFDRQRRILGWEQSALEQATILVIGAGALGNEVCKNLAQSGVGDLVIVDHDSVEVTNLNRCIFFRNSDVGGPKADILGERINAAFPHTKTSPQSIKCEDLHVDAYVGAQVVVSCVDNIDTRLTINRYCSFYDKPLVDGGTSGLYGRVQTIIPPQSACLECRWKRQGLEIAQQRHRCGNEIEIFDRTEPALGITTSAVAAIQASEVVKLLQYLRISDSDSRRTIISNTLVDKMWAIDLQANLFNINTLMRDPDCPSHGDLSVFSAPGN